MFDAGVVALSGLMATKRTATRRNVEGAHEQQNKEQKRKTPKKHWRKAKLIGSEGNKHRRRARGLTAVPTLNDGFVLSLYKPLQKTVYPSVL